MTKESQEELQMQMKGFFLGGKRLHVQERHDGDKPRR